MVDSQEIIERSFYQALLDVSVDLGITLDPSEYIPTTPENISKFKNDKEANALLGRPLNKEWGVKI